MSKWDFVKHFTRMEFLCPCCKKEDMDEDFVYRLDRIRTSVGRPLIVNSGWRCAKYNASKKVGGKKNSAHLIGRAADIRMVDSGLRFLFYEMARDLGFNRFGVGTNFIHIDSGTEHTGHPLNQMWTYPS
ncbi:MAG: YcbK family protein [bacterium]